MKKKFTGDDFWGSVEVEIAKIRIEADTDDVVRIAGKEVSPRELKTITNIFLAILEHGMEGLADYEDEE